MQKIKPYQRKQLQILAVFVLLFLGSFADQIQAAPQAPQAAATAASLEVPNSYAPDTIVTIKVFDVLAAGASFGISFYYDASGTETLEAKAQYANRSVQLGTGDDDWIYSMAFPAPTAGEWIRIKVVDALSGTTTELAAAQLDVTDTEGITTALTDFVVTIGVALMIVFIFIAIVASIRKKRG